MIDATDDLCAKLWRLLESGNLQSVSDALSEHANEPNICPNATSVGCKRRERCQATELGWPVSSAPACGKPYSKLFKDR